MDFLTGNTRKLYVKFLISSMCSALVVSIYSFVDTIAIGQSEGTLGAAAMAVISPFYGLLTFLAVLVGIGGSVLLGTAKGEGREEKGNAYFTASVILMAAITAAAWLAFIFCHNEIFIFFGANTEVMPKVMEYAAWLIRFFPVFIAPGFISAFIRNDNAPGLTMAAVIAGGAVNIFLDWFLVFPLGMGMRGAAVATVTGTCLQVVIMCGHFFRKKCGLKFVKPYKIGTALRNILSIGFGAGVLSLGTVILSVIMNRQIMKYGGTTELAVYGVIATVSSLFQCLFDGVGQAIQPLISANCGAKKTERVRSFWRMSLGTVIALGIVFTAIGEFLPVPLIRLFMRASPEVIAAAPGIMRSFFPLFLTLGITVVSIYYLQSTMREKMSMLIALLRSVVVSGLLLFTLPLFCGINGVWVAMPVSEAIAAVVAIWYIYKKAQ